MGLVATAVLCGECGEPAIARSLCMRCYQQARRRGTLPPRTKRASLATPPATTPLERVLGALCPNGPVDWGQMRREAGRIPHDSIAEGFGEAISYAEQGELGAARMKAWMTVERAVRA